MHFVTYYVTLIIHTILIYKNIGLNLTSIIPAFYVKVLLYKI